MISALSAHSLQFPAISGALEEPNGLLAVGGDLSPPRLLEAYRLGIFPWFSDDDPILWWSPDPRGVIFPEQLHISRSLRKFVRNCNYTCTFNQAFAEVISGCIAQREHTEGSWITDDMYEAYCDLHDLGHAHSVEVWSAGRLVGGLYGILNGQVFCGESMFHHADHASKIALMALVQHLSPAGLGLIDCQIPNPHLLSLGAQALPRAEFLPILQRLGETKIEHEYLTPQSISGICR